MLYFINHDILLRIRQYQFPQYINPCIDIMLTLLQLKLVGEAYLRL